MLNFFLKNLISATLGFFLLFCTIFFIYLLRYYEPFDITFFVQFVLLFGILGCLPMLFGRRVFGGIFLGGVSLGFAVNCIVSYFIVYPSIHPEIYQGVVIVLFAITGVVLDVRIARRKKNQENR